MQVKPKAGQYRVEQLLPVWIAERAQFVAVAFRLVRARDGRRGSTEVCGIQLREMIGGRRGCREMARRMHMHDAGGGDLDDEQTSIFTILDND